MKKIINLFLATLLLLTPLAQADGIFSSNKFDFLKGEPELMPVDQAFVFDFKQQGEQVKISWVIADGYYMYRDKLKFETTDGAVLGEISLPQGKSHTDEYFGEQEVYYTYVEIPVAIKQANAGDKLNVTFMGCAEGKLCFPPTKRSAELTDIAPNDGLLTANEKPLTNSAPVAQTPTAPITQQDSLSAMLSSDSLIWTLVIFFGLGIGLALTPCVFPMYPILSGIIVGQGNKLDR